MKKNEIKAEERDLLSQKSEILNRVTLFRYNEALRDIMEKEVYLCRADDTITSVAKVMARQRISSAIVTDAEHMPVGIVTERDIVQKVIAEDDNHPVDRGVFNIRNHQYRGRRGSRPPRMENVRLLYVNIHKCHYSRYDHYEYLLPRLRYNPGPG